MMTNTIMWEMIAEIPSYSYVPTQWNPCGTHIADRHTQYIEQDKPPHAVRGWCVIGLRGATASLIINSSEDHTSLITLSLSEWRWSQKRAHAHIRRCATYYTHTHTANTFFITTITKCSTHKELCAVSRSTPNTVRTTYGHFAVIL